MKKILYLLLFIPVLSFSQRVVPYNYSFDFRLNIQVRDTAKLDKVLFEDGTLQNTAYNIDSVAAQIHDSLQNVTTVESDPVWVSDSSNYISKSQARSDIHDSIATIEESLYIADSSYLKSNVRELLARTDTTQELVSRTIYINQTTGNDTTGTGLIGAPFRTFGKAKTTIKHVVAASIIFDFNTGAHNIYQSDMDYLSDNIIIKTRTSADACIIFKGNMVILVSSLVCTKDVNNPFRFNVASVSWTTNQYEGRFISSGTTFYPIESNTSNTIEGAIRLMNNGTYNIYEDSTTLNFIGLTSSVGLNFPIRSYAITGFAATQGSSIRFLNCKIKTNTNTLLTAGGDTRGPFFRFCHFNNNNTVISNQNTLGSVILANCYIKFNQTVASAATISSSYGSITDINNCVIKNSVRTGGIAIGAGFSGIVNLSNSVISNYLKCMTNSHNGSMITVVGGVYYKNSTYLMYSSGTLNIDIGFSSIDYQLYDITNLLYSAETPIKCYLKLFKNEGYTNIWDPSSPFITRSYIDVNNKIDINIPGIYREYQQKQSVTLADNSTDSISIADLTYNRSVELKVNLVRGTDYQIKTLKLLNTGTTYNFVQLGDSIQTGDLGVRFDGVYRSGGSNTLKLKWHTTNTGAAATLTYDAYRQNF